MIRYFENLLFLLPFCFGVVLTITGFLSYKYPPKEINELYGYRSKRAKKNQQQWDFAQIYGAKQLFKNGLLLFVFSFLGFFIQMKEVWSVSLSLLLLLLAVINTWFSTEKAIKSKFNSK